MHHIIPDKLGKDDSSYLLLVDFNEYLNFLVDEIKWEPLLWDESQMTIEPFYTKIQRRTLSSDGETYQVDAQRLRIRIPISPHPQMDDYFKFGPSKWRGIEPEWRFEGNVLIYEVDASKRAVEQGLEQVRFWLGNRNAEIEVSFT
jgi:hypothetical protein